ncbi:oxidoreductase [Cupriavidus lacunae]|uniref:Short-chain dehydrogenase/reductase n=1 Tax=Cupriavidus lacunae TaxID=2666307 RepID=A0A370NSR1_9BURK|nr:oxidoreductase [Cupriavidus lacunae]RDK08624.1 short-chain dehydrogenase/reductase [Cupriavidus lacunae]
MNQHNRSVLLITGANSGFGRALAEAALANGHTVIGTVRSVEAKEALERLHENNAYGVVLDVTDFAAIEPAIHDIVARVGPIDVLVNNAGYGHEGTVEESSLEELIRQFNTNVFGAVAMIKAVLPSMRARRTGHIVNITSMAGHVGLPGVAYYCGSKFALEGISESLAREVGPLGIKVTSVAPGSFRTDWAGRSMVRSEHTIEDYDPIFGPIRRARQAKSGRQAGDPAKAAAVLLQLVGNDDPPVNLLLGNDAYDLVMKRLSALSETFQAWETTTRSTDY